VSDSAFDMVKSRDGNLMTAAEFMALPLNDRVRMVLKREATFYSRGQPIEQRLALQKLMGGSAR
jgi:hypothetical protein